jgi:elongation factor G
MVSRKKQSGGPGEFARVMGYMEPTGALEENKFEQQVIGGSIVGGTVVDDHASAENLVADQRALLTREVEALLASIMTDSSEMSFKNATQQAFRKAFAESQPSVLEPLMNTVVDDHASAENLVADQRALLTREVEALLASIQEPTVPPT